MKISLITVCYNSERTIEDTIKSVLKQNYKNYEYIIVDGLSTDNTLNILKKYYDEFEGKMRIISEPDKGLYDAMNKGISLSTGDIIGILNSDDILSNCNVFNDVIENINNYDGVYSNLLFLDEKTMTKNVRKFIAGNYKKRFGWHPPHPTLYLKKEVYTNVGKFNLEYKIAADLDFMLRVIKCNYKLKYFKGYFVYMRSGGVSTNGLKGYYKNFKESLRVLKNNNVRFALFVNFIRIFKTIWQGINAKLSR